MQLISICTAPSVTLLSLRSSRSASFIRVGHFYTVNCLNLLPGSLTSSRLIDAHNDIRSRKWPADDSFGDAIVFNDSATNNRQYRPHPIECQGYGCVRPTVVQSTLHTSFYGDDRDNISAERLVMETDKKEIYHQIWTSLRIDKAKRRLKSAVKILSTILEGGQVTRLPHAWFAEPRPSHNETFEIPLQKRNRARKALGHLKKKAVTGKRSVRRRAAGGV
ncbi:hypothetical protein EVAR_65865_1 [Eumeta japonica]|uniref:Uncharacterized protein n=1 Tax=Eumeta variegata TaxID=151549 RepID=A0A4C1ZKH7_EUMVA|nr:hypothetical protein EVAR_65865_1 [Eumeta japonica]